VYESPSSYISLAVIITNSIIAIMFGRTVNILQQFTQIVRQGYIWTRSGFAHDLHFLATLVQVIHSILWISTLCGTKWGGYFLSTLSAV
jgi:hypothetical protein